MGKWICTNCGGDSPRSLQRGMCPGCYRFWYRHGVMKSQETMTRLSPGSNRRLCKNCHEGIAFVKELCRRCYEYQLRTGKRRPKHLWRDACLNCGKPYNKPRDLIKGRCKNCYHHWCKYGRDRDVAIVWCDCGQPATHKDVTLSFTLGTGHTTTEKYNLCQDCYDLEFEPLQTKGEAVWNR